MSDHTIIGEESLLNMLYSPFSFGRGDFSSSWQCIWGGGGEISYDLQKAGKQKKLLTHILSGLDDEDSEA